MKGAEREMITVLLIEDNPADARLIGEMLSEARGAVFNLETAERLSSGMERIAQGGIDVLLLDLTLPDSEGLATFLKARAHAPNMPILLLTGLDNELLAIEAVREGAQDYLVKGRLDADLLARSLRYAIERKRTERALKQAKAFNESVINSLSDAVYIIDVRDFTLIGANRVFLEDIGKSEEEIIGKHCHDVLCHGDVAAREQNVTCLSECAAYETLKTGRTAVREHVHYDKEGKRKDVEVTANPMRNESGEVTHIINVAKDITHRKRMDEIIRHQAYHDTLTGLPNRMLFSEHLNHELSHAHRSRQMLAVLFLDLDNFKTINDTLGHTIGDGLLKAVAERIRNCLREFDTVSRQGGDEYTVLLPDIKHHDDVTRIAKKLLAAFKQPWVIDTHELTVTASVGISLYPYDGDDAETLLKNADTAMYHAKEQGKNNYQFYNPAMNLKALERMILESSLRASLDRNEFVLHYQPLVRIDTGEIIGAEALVRWLHPELGMIYPEQFIRLAEETGLIVPLNEWVLRTACAQNRAWQKADLGLMHVSVNLSARLFQQKNLAETVMRILSDTGLDSAFLDLEVTESIAMQQAETSLAAMRALSNRGVKLVIDDFGTGYSSLGTLKKLPVQALKIDRSLVSDMTTNPDDSAIVSAIIPMAHRLKMKTIAEGVETREQLAFLDYCKCDVMQGYLFNRPVTADEFERLLTERKHSPHQSSPFT
ncbi:MAG: putative bifunctional diguanylate cyclase/phosphodiesterase [Nitrospirota bacterium]